MEELVGDTKSIKKKEVVYNVSQGNQPNWVRILAPLLPGGVTLCLSSLVCMMGLKDNQPQVPLQDLQE